MKPEQALEILEKARDALLEVYDDEIQRQPPNTYRIGKIDDLVDTVNRELTALRTVILEGTAERYEPITKEIRGARNELKWARDKVDSFVAAADKVDAIVKMATTVIGLL